MEKQSEKIPVASLRLRYRRSAEDEDTRTWRMEPLVYTQKV